MKISTLTRMSTLILTDPKKTTGTQMKTLMTGMRMEKKIVIEEVEGRVRIYEKETWVKDESQTGTISRRVKRGKLPVPNVGNGL